MQRREETKDGEASSPNDANWIPESSMAEVRATFNILLLFTNSPPVAPLLSSLLLSFYFSFV